MKLRNKVLFAMLCVMPEKWTEVIALGAKSLFLRLASPNNLGIFTAAAAAAAAAAADCRACGMGEQARLSIQMLASGAINQ